jgi:hypothetical protein
MSNLNTLKNRTKFQYIWVLDFKRIFIFYTEIYGY